MICCGGINIGAIQHQQQILMNIKILLSMSVMKNVYEYIESQFKRDQFQSELSLQFMCIKDLAPLMGLLSQFKKLKTLILHGNSLSQLPNNLHRLNNIEDLDITNNSLLRDIQPIVNSLETLPKLKHLKIAIRKKEDIDYLKRLIKLQTLNGQQVKKIESKKKKVLRYLNENQLAKLKDKIQYFYKKCQKFQSAYIESGFNLNQQEDILAETQKIIADALFKLNEKDGDISDSLDLVMYHLIKKQILDMILKRVLNICYDQFGTVMTFLKEVLEENQSISQTITRETLQILKNIGEQYQFGNMQENSHLQKLKIKNDQLKQELLRIKKNKEKIQIQYNRLEVQNTKLLGMLAKEAKSNSYSMMIPNKFNNVSEINSATDNMLKNLNNTKKNKDKKIKEENNVEEANSKIISSLPNGRNMSIKKLKETIKEIYEGKLKQDKKNLKAKLPLETMHQYIFSHLNKKYGLKNLTIESASSIISAVQAYSDHDNDVKVFHKILRNQIDQQFPKIQNEVKFTVQNALKLYLENTNPYKNADSIETMMRERIQNYISKNEAEEIVKSLYNFINAEQILTHLETIYTSQKNGSATNRSSKEKKKVRYTDFVETLLNFELEMHEKFIKPVLMHFRNNDGNNDGILTRNELKATIKSLNQDVSETLSDLLQIADPNNTDAITFTSTVKLVSKYPLKNPILSPYN